MKKTLSLYFFILSASIIYSQSNYIEYHKEVRFVYQQMGVPGAILSGYYSIDKLLTDE